MLETRRRYCSKLMGQLVESYSGIEYPETPRALYWHGERLEISEILGSWRTPDGKGFRVQTEDQQVFELFYAEDKQEWIIGQPITKKGE